ncbi:MAG: transposase [Actinobacteria bacterium]|nr:transposase [Actinomycetota bacterium]
MWTREIVRHHLGAGWPHPRGPHHRSPILGDMISAVTATGSFKYDIVSGTLDADKFIDFCDKLLTDTEGPVFLVVDGHPVHRSRAVTDYVASTQGRLRLFRLPSYSPELNPDEWVWKSNTTPSAATPPPVLMTSPPRSSPHSNDSPNYLTSSEHSSAIPTFATSPHEPPRPVYILTFPLVSQILIG